MCSELDLLGDGDADLGHTGGAERHVRG
jgi:hypothetical protein